MEKTNYKAKLLKLQSEFHNMKIRIDTEIGKLMVKYRDINDYSQTIRIPAVKSDLSSLRLAITQNANTQK